MPDPPVRTGATLTASVAVAWLTDVFVALNMTVMGDGLKTRLAWSIWAAVGS